MSQNIELGSELCQNCGLCCNGALFSDAPIFKGEEEKAKEIGLKSIKSADNQNAFSQPCVHLSGTRCSVYPNRLRICGDYHCDLTTAVINGDISFDDANSDVMSAKEQIKWLTENALHRDLADTNPFNLRDYLHFFRKKIKAELEKGSISQVDVIFTIKALAYLKLIHHSFRNTSLYQNYGYLINSIHKQ